MRVVLFLIGLFHFYSPGVVTVGSCNVIIMSRNQAGIAKIFNGEQPIIVFSRAVVRRVRTCLLCFIIDSMGTGQIMMYVY